MKISASSINKLAKAYVDLGLRSKIDKSSGTPTFVAGDQDCSLMFENGKEGKTFIAGVMPFGGLNVLILDDYQIAIEAEDGSVAYLSDERVGAVLVKHFDNLVEYFTILSSENAKG